MKRKMIFFQKAYILSLALLISLGAKQVNAQENKTAIDAIPAIIYLLLGDSEEPSVEFSELTDNQAVEQGQLLQVEAIVTNGGNVSRVELSVDGTLVRADLTAPYQWGDVVNQDPQLANLSVGTHTLSLVAIQANGRFRLNPNAARITKSGAGQPWDRSISGLGVLSWKIRRTARLPR